MAWSEGVCYEIDNDQVGRELLPWSGSPFLSSPTARQRQDHAHEEGRHCVCGPDKPAVRSIVLYAMGITYSQITRHIYLSTGIIYCITLPVW